MDEVPTRECPLCREEIRSDAVRCKHCHGSVEPETAGHGGTCPLCKEEIHPEALRCKHCQADLGPASPGSRSYPRRSASGAGRRYEKGACSPAPVRVLRRSQDAGITTGPTHPGSPCPEWVDDDGWFGILVDWDDRSCTYDPY